MTIRRTVVILVVLLVGALVAYMALVGQGTYEPDAGLHSPASLELPTSPRDATYRIEGQEVTLMNGAAEREAAPGSATQVTTRIFGEPVYADINGDGADDAVLFLTQDSGGSGTFYYVAAALKDGDGYLGTNAILLGDRVAPDTISVQSEVIMANYAARATDTPMVDQPSIGTTAYLTVSGATLVPVGTLGEGEAVFFGMLVYGHEARTFTPCGSEVEYWLSPDSRARAALEAIYNERTVDAEPYTPVFIVVRARVVPPPLDGFGADYEHAIAITSILSAPTAGACGERTQ